MNDRNSKLRPTRLLTGICLIVATGCASPLAGTAAESAAPDWYEARVAEASKGSYPKIVDVPPLESYEAARSSIEAGAMSDAELRARFLSNPRSEPAYLTPSEIQAWGAALKQQVAQRDVAANFLTDEDVAQLRAVFDRPRARR